jgi:DNA-binding transcriptional regulator YiaG
MTLAFRSVDAAFADAVQTWPYEALVETMERGLIGDWMPILDELRTAPWGLVARKVQRWASRATEEPAAAFFSLAIDRVRQRAEAAERAEVVRRIRGAIERSGVTAAEFALLVGTSASRMSTYANGRVMPSAAMLLRIERTGKHRRVTSGSQ